MIQTLTFILTILTSLVAIVALVSVLKYRVDLGETKGKEVTGKLEEFSANLNRLVADLKVLTAEQSIINKFTSNMLESLEHRLEDYAANHEACYENLHVLFEKRSKDKGTK